MTGPHALDEEAAGALRSLWVDEAEALAACARAGGGAVSLPVPPDALRLLGNGARSAAVPREVTLHAREHLGPDGALVAVRWSTRELVRSLEPKPWRAWTRPASVRLLRVVTGDDRHLEEPVAWFVGRTGLDVVRDRRTPSRRDFWLRAPDGATRGIASLSYWFAAHALWRGWLADRGWSPARPNDLATTSDGAARDAGLPWEAAPSESFARCLEREGVAWRAELDASDRLLRRLTGDAG